jgi:hypothetical protein
MSGMTRAVKKALARPAFHWKMHSHFGGTKQHGLLYRDDDKGVQMEIITGRTKGLGGSFHKPRHYFFIDDDKRTFRTEEELMAAWKEAQLGRTDC